MKEIIRYYREDGKPRGCLVAIGKDKIGWSLCHRNDGFTKELARKIAKGRAVKGTKQVLPWELADLYLLMVTISKDYQWG